jgi:methylated-DNA-[protein]-cysteine S-methyltransferase
MQYTASFHSPIGTIRLHATDTALYALHFDDVTVGDEQVNPVLEEAIVQLSAYFAGTLTQFELPVLQPGTQFQQKIWQLLTAIPFGETTSYQALSQTYGDVKAIRAIAAANAKNSLAIVVPCHRVVGSDGALTGFAWGLERKHWLLEHEAKISGKRKQMRLF